MFATLYDRSCKDKKVVRKQLLKCRKVELINECKRRNIRYSTSRNKSDLVESILKKQFKRQDTKKRIKARNKWFKQVSQYGCEMKHEYLMHGYLKEVHELKTCPVDLIILMLTYLGIIIALRFDLTHRKYKANITNNGTRIKMALPNDWRYHYGSAVYGSSKGFKRDKHIWHIRSTREGKSQKHYGTHSLVGIISNKKIPAHGATYDGLRIGRYQKCALYYVCNSSKKMEFCIDGCCGMQKGKFDGWQKNDVITVILDCKKWTVEFRLNNKIICQAMKIEQRKYYPIIASRNQGEIFQIVY